MTVISNQEGATFAVASVYTPEIEDVRRISEPSRVAYCRRHGYAYVATHESLAPDRPAEWSKIELVRRMLARSPPSPRRRFHWVMWLDADALIMRPDVDLGQVTQRLGAAEADLLIGTDWNGLNNGVFFIRNCPASREFLDRVWGHTDRIHAAFLEQGRTKGMGRTKGEQRG